jgi:hypothetical protein
MPEYRIEVEEDPVNVRIGGIGGGSWVRLADSYHLYKRRYGNAYKIRACDEAFAETVAGYLEGAGRSATV